MNLTQLAIVSSVIATVLLTISIDPPALGGGIGFALVAVVITLCKKGDG